MKIDFNKLETQKLEHFLNGNGLVLANIFNDGKVKVIKATFKPGSYNGEHKHDTSLEIVYVLKGKATFYLNNEIEVCNEGEAHYCKQGESHYFKNNENEDLEVLCIVPQIG